MPFDIVMHNLVIDIGNTNHKLAVFSQRDLIHYQKFSQFDEKLLQQIVETYQVENVTVSSVGVDDEKLIGLIRKMARYVPFSTKIEGKIKNYYQSLSTLGLDRWAKVIAASGLYANQNCLMIDAGTCITYDVLTSENEYFGGSISLGIQMRFSALNHYTNRLPLINWNIEEDIPKGSNTENAIKSGVLQGVINEVVGFIAAENQKYVDLKVIITGGDADFLNKQLKNSIFASQIIHEPYLVLKGLNEVITLSYVQ